MEKQREVMARIPAAVNINRHTKSTIALDAGVNN
jgi:hypothetical protein